MKFLVTIQPEDLDLEQAVYNSMSINILKASDEQMDTAEKKALELETLLEPWKNEEGEFLVEIDDVSKEIKFVKTPKLNFPTPPVIPQLRPIIPPALRRN